jgi:uncharacterized repeat protein (TIGR02543 family)
MKYLKYLATLLLALASQLQLAAQDYDPTNPAEPYLYNKLTVTGRPTEAISSLSGAGYYKEGTKVTLRSYARSSTYTFSHWEKDGEWYSDVAQPTYTMENDAVTFTAVYTFTPSSPDEPQLNDNRLYLVAEPLTACTFNKASGQSYKYDQTVSSLRATPATGYTFLGWYDGSTLMSENLTFSFNMPDRDVTLVARFEYNPANPLEPSLPDGTEQDNIQTTPTGDANGDGVVDVADAVRVINLCLTGEYAGKADVDGDGVVDVADAVRVINACLKN